MCKFLYPLFNVDPRFSLLNDSFFFIIKRWSTSHYLETRSLPPPFPKKKNLNKKLQSKCKSSLIPFPKIKRWGKNEQKKKRREKNME